jgi:hypothetical protein
VVQYNFEHFFLLKILFSLIFLFFLRRIELTFFFDTQIKGQVFLEIFKFKKGYWKNEENYRTRNFENFQRS